MVETSNDDIAIVYASFQSSVTNDFPLQLSAPQFLDTRPGFGDTSPQRSV